MRLVILAATLLGLAAGPAVAQAPCPASFEGRDQAIACQCSAGAAAEGRVWGSGPYTSDSAPCRAGLHAGVIPPTGGTIVVSPAPGQPAYRGSSAHGVVSQNYGSWPDSFSVAAPGSKGEAALPACPTDFGDRAAPLVCLCTPEAVRAQAPVWGSGPYTSDSAICRAALHAGAVGAGGGSVLVSPAPGEAAYRGSQAHGIATTDYGSWPSSFTVAPGAAAPAAAACPEDFQAQTGPLTCGCSTEAAASGNVWGSGIYTTDSRICRAARHAGLVGDSGGVVNVVPAPGQPAYAGSTAHGVTSRNYGSWPASFTFRR